MSHNVVMIVCLLIQVSFIAVLAIFLFNNKQAVDKFLKRALVVLRILLVILAADEVQVLLHV